MMRFLYGFSVLVLVVASILFYIYLGDAGHPLIIHWSRGGIDFVGTPVVALGILWTSAAMVVINALLSSVFASRARFIAYLLAGASAFLSLLILIAVGSIILVN